MAPALSQPLLLFCQAILLGMAAALLYDLLRAFRLRLPRLTSALDILYCMAAGLAVFLFMLRRAQGQLRLYLLLGEKPSARGALGASYAAEALAGEEDLVVEGADWAEETQRLTVYLRWQGAPLQAAVQL